MNCAIIDDESSGREILSELITFFVPKITQIRSAHSVESGLALLNEYHPQLVFLDVEMADGTGFDLLAQLEQRKFEVVFVSAYKHYAIPAIKAAALDYLLKPVNIEELQAAAERALTRIEKITPTGAASLPALMPADRKKQERISLPILNGFEIVRLEEILYCRSEENYTRFYLRGAKQLLVSKTIKTYEEVLENNGFMRIHKSHIVCMSQITRYLHSKGGEVQMSDGAVLEVSRARKQTLLDRL